MSDVCFSVSVWTVIKKKKNPHHLCCVPCSSLVCCWCAHWPNEQRDLNFRIRVWYFHWKVRHPFYAIEHNAGSHFYTRAALRSAVFQCLNNVSKKQYERGISGLGSAARIACSCRRRMRRWSVRVRMLSLGPSHFSVNVPYSIPPQDLYNCFLILWYSNKKRESDSEWDRFICEHVSMHVKSLCMFAESAR